MRSVKILMASVVLLGLVACGSGALACGPFLGEAIQEAVGADPAVASPAIDRLRAMGPFGVDVYRQTYQEILTAGPLAQSESDHADYVRRVHSAYDQICGQKDAYASRLYWYTDLEKAKEQAAAENKPILSLRLLGKLTDEYSCANSRFFRTALYPDPTVAATLREYFILHWESVRPAPVVTVDFGNGRSYRCTVTGNSIHYILDAKGRPVEAIPGLVDPRMFNDLLLRAEPMAKASLELDNEAARVEMLAKSHREWLDQLNGQIQTDIANAALASFKYQRDSGNSFPTAAEAAPIALSKMAVEAPIIRAIDLQQVDAALERLDAQQWDQVAAGRIEQVVLSEPSLALMRTQLQTSPEQFEEVVTHFRKTIAVDTAQNEYQLHRKIHEWFVNNQVGDDPTELNRRVYDELFLTPAEDPWLGIVSKNVYTALHGNGLARAEAQ